MNQRQKEALEAQLNSEKRTLNELRQVYRQAMKDCDEKIRELSMRTDLENLQSIIYQKRYQEVLKGQLGSVLDKLHTEEYATVADYLARCYEDGYIGTMYDIHGQGVPVICPIDQRQVVSAIQTHTKLSKSLYERLGEDVDSLRTSIRAEISRGAATGMTWNAIAGKIAKSFKNTPFNKAYNQAMRIARTEGHRIASEAASNAQYAAREKGADVLKQWDATLDGRTRPSHREVDGEIRELDEVFSNGLQYPGDPKGAAAEVINCRCALLQRARWALDEDELNTLQERAEFFLLDKSAKFEEFKERYLKIPVNADTVEIGKLPKPTDSSDLIYDRFFKTLNDKLKVEYNAVENHKEKMTSDDIINALSGGDLTGGSCASLGLAYIGQKQGWDVLDFRGGESQSFFSNGYNLMQLSQVNGLKSINADGKTAITVGSRLLKQCETGKEYYLSCGRHASIVRKLENGKLQYLELQSARSSGWTDFDGNPKYTLVNRFGCNSRLPSVGDFMIDIDDSNFNTNDFKALLGYINTTKSEQKKGQYGTIK